MSINIEKVLDIFLCRDILKIKMEEILMPKGKKNSAASAVSKTASKTVEPIKKTAAKPEKESMKLTAEKKKATAPKKAAATKSSARTSAAKKAPAHAAAKANSAKTAAASKPAKKAAPKTEKKAAVAPVKSKKAAVKKTVKSKADEVVIQSGEKDYKLSEITQLCKDAYRGGTKKQIKSIKVYVKAEGNKLKAYYVVNDSVNGSVDL